MRGRHSFDFPPAFCYLGTSLNTNSLESKCFSHMTSIPRNHFLILFGLVLLTLSAGCGRIVGHYTRPLFDDLTRSFMQQGDVVIAEQGTPAFLLVLDGLIEHSPKNESLLLVGAQAYSAYTAAFVGPKEPERNKRLTEKAKGMRDTLEGIYQEVNGLYLSVLSPQEQQGFFGAADKICSLAQNQDR